MSIELVYHILLVFEASACRPTSNMGLLSFNLSWLMSFLVERTSVSLIISPSVVPVCFWTVLLKGWYLHCYLFQSVKSVLNFDLISFSLVLSFHVINNWLDIRLDCQLIWSQPSWFVPLPDNVHGSSWFHSLAELGPISNGFRPLFQAEKSAKTKSPSLHSAR